MATPTLAEMRTRVRERARVSANDPMFTDIIVNRHINLAYGNFLSSQPDGWWWQRVEQTVQGPNADTAILPVRLVVPDATRLIRKVFSVFVSLDGDYWLPIQPRERQDQIRLAGGRRSSDGLPLSWAVVPVAGTATANIGLVFDPPLAPLTFVRYICVAGAADLTADGSFLYGLPSILADAVVDAVAGAMIRQRRGATFGARRFRYLSELAIATGAAEQWLKAARTYMATPAAGPGYTTMLARTGP